MYPAQALADGEYSASDLPDAVTVDETSFNRSGTSYGNTTNGVILEENVWAKYRNTMRSTRACLIQGGVEDQFADTYTLSWSAFGSGSISATVERESLCVWSGIDPCGVPIYLFYGDNEAIPQGGDALGWNVRINIYVGSCSSPDGGESIQKRNDPSALQNTPIGVYLASTTTNVTVS
jgi:hypothetical protein